MGMIVEFTGTHRCTLCGTPVDPARADRFSVADLRGGWGCPCAKRRPALVAEAIPELPWAIRVGLVPELGDRPS